MGNQRPWAVTAFLLRFMGILGTVTDLPPIVASASYRANVSRPVPDVELGLTHGRKRLLTYAGRSSSADILPLRRSTIITKLSFCPPRNSTRPAC